MIKILKYGDLENFKRILYVDDLAYCIENISKDLNEDLYNVGSGEEVSILNLKIKTVGFMGFKF